MFSRARDVPDVQYVGSPSTTDSCLQAIVASVHFDGPIAFARLLSCDGRHGFYLNVDGPSSKVVRCGFTSGYSGEGPAGLARALELLALHRIDVEEIAVSQGLLERIDAARLTHADLQWISAAQVVRPTRIYDYRHDGLVGRDDSGGFSGRYHPLSMPWSMLDSRLIQVALQFESDPDMAIFRAFRDLEDHVKTRCSLPVEVHGVDVFKKAFRGSGSLLVWENKHRNESDGQAQLFEGAYAAIRNARAHRVVSVVDLHRAYRELLLVNELYLLERESKPR